MFENTLTIKIYNYLRCRKKKKIFNYLNNIQFDIKKIIIEQSKTEYYRLFIFNNLSRSPAIDLENSDIKKRPLKLFYHVDKIDKSQFISEYSIISQLNQLTDSPSDFDSPLFFDVNKYLSRDKNYPNSKFSNYSQDFLSKIMRFSKYFFTYYVRDPNEIYKSTMCRNFLIIGINTVIIAGVSSVFNHSVKMENVFGVLFSSICCAVVVDVIIFLIIYCLNKRTKRIDFIYSADFNNIFIGIVPINEKYYKNTFEFKLNDVNKFYVREDSKKSFLSVIIDNNNIDIYQIDDKKDLDNFVLVLNEKNENN